MVRSAYDVVVIGGGPAGLRTATVAARRGASVLLVERSAGIGIPVRTSGASSIRELRRLGLPDRLWHPIHVVRFISPNNEAVFRYETPTACVLDVRALYQYLAGEAAEAGAEIALKTTALGLDRGGAGLRLRLRRDQEERTVAAALAVDAAGHAAHFARKEGLPVDRGRYGVGAEIDFYAPAFDEEQLFLIVGSQVAPCGYAWAFPYGNHRVRVGVGVIHPDSTANPARYLDEIRERVPALAPMLRRAQPIEVHSGALPSTPPNPRFVADRFLVVGDAGGQASTLVGEGIRFALMAGDFAGAAIGEALASGDLSAEALYRLYERPWRRRWGRSMAMSYAINRVIARYDDATWDRRVELLKSLSPALFAEGLHADFTPGLLLRLARHLVRHPRVLAHASARLARGALDGGR